MFSCEFCQISKDTSFVEHLRTATSVVLNPLNANQMFKSLKYSGFQSKQKLCNIWLFFSYCAKNKVFHFPLRKKSLVENFIYCALWVYGENMLYRYISNINISCRERFCKIAFLKSMIIFSKKHLWWSAVFIKIRLHCWCFPEKFIKILRTVIIENICGRLFLENKFLA